MPLSTRLKPDPYRSYGPLLSIMPLRHQTRGGTDLGTNTRVLESMTEHTCNGLRRLGMSAYGDVMTDGGPLSVSQGRVAA